MHSAQDLVKASEQITRYERLFTEIRKMKMVNTGNITVTNGQVIMGVYNEQSANSYNKNH